MIFVLIGMGVIFLSGCTKEMDEPDALNSDKFSPESAVALLKSFLNITFGQGDWIEVSGDQQLYFNRELLEKKNISLEDMQVKTANFINQFEGIKSRCHPRRFLRATTPKVSWR